MIFYYFEVEFSRYSNYHKNTTHCVKNVCTRANSMIEGLCTIIEGASISSPRSLFYDVLISAKLING